MKKIALLIIMMCLTLSACSNNEELSLSVEEYIIWGKHYYLGFVTDGNATVYHPLFYDDEGNKTMVATDMTKRYVDIINYYLFVYPEDNNDNAKKVFEDIANNNEISRDLVINGFEKYGITKDNPLTVDWIVLNPYNSYKLLFDSWSMSKLNCDIEKLLLNNNDFIVFGTIYNLSYEEYTEYFKCYCAMPGYNWVFYKGVKAINNFNAYFFTETNINQSKEYQQVLTIVESYGLSKDNPMDEVWVSQNPYEAYHLMKALPDSVREEIFMVDSEE
jgi:hypothetical protein